jgi:hypothetical protein
MSDTIRHVSDYYDELVSQKKEMSSIYQDLGDYCLPRKSNFYDFPGGKGNILKGVTLYDQTAERSAETAAATVKGMLWPDAERSFVLRPSIDIINDEETQTWFGNHVNRQMYKYMDLPEAGFSLAADEQTIDAFVFGTSSMAILEKDSFTVPVIYRPWNVRDFAIAENEDGFVDTIGRSDFLTPAQMIRTFGEAVSSKTKEAFARRSRDKIEVVNFILPRDTNELQGKSGNRNMPWRSIWYEAGTKKILRESGFLEFPVPTTRFKRVNSFAYGHSAGMSSLSDVFQLNAVMYSLTNAIEKSLNPPLGVMQDALGYGDILDTSARGITVFQPSMLYNSGDRPVFPIHTIENLQWAEKFVLLLKENITSSFLIDRLLDLNNTTQMTLGETLIRDKIRGTTLASVFNRQTMEMYDPAIRRTFNILFRKGFLGFAKGLTPAIPGVDFEIPPKIAERVNTGLDIYDIQYINPAKRMLQREEMQGIVSAFSYIAGTPQLQEALDLISMDKITKKITRLEGFSEDLYNSDTEVESMRQARAQQIEELKRLEQQKIAAGIAKDSASAQQMGAQANATDRGSSGQQLQSI